jgi:hypothetical protein
MLRQTRQAIRRAFVPIVTIAFVYAGGLAIGGILVHSGNATALKARDALVARANAADPAALALAGGHRLRAAAWDFGRNLVLGAVPDTVGGLAIVIPYLTGFHRGFVGGIVSVDGTHRSRLNDQAERVYYLVTLVLQLVPYTLAGGAGVQAGLAYLRRVRYPGPRWLGLPRVAVIDVASIYILIVPLFLVASLWEFLMR